MDSGAKRPPSRQLIELLCKALLDEELRERLFTDLDAVAREFCLSPAEGEAIMLLDRERFERVVARLR
jgi:hypothetical protein